MKKPISHFFKSQLPSSKLQTVEDVDKISDDLLVSTIIQELNIEE